MRVLIKKSSNESVNHIYGGIARVLLKAGLQPICWDSSLKPAFDAFDEFRPDIFFASDYDLSHADMKCLNEYRQTLFILHRQYPQPESYHDLKQYGAQPDLEIASVGEKLAGSYLSVPCAMDVLNNSRANEQAAFSIAAIASKTEFEQFLKPLCDMRYAVNIALFSDTPLGTNQYFGSPIGNEPTIYNRSFLNLIFGGEHESNYKIYDCIKCGGLPIAQFNHTDQSLLNSTFPTFNSTDDIKEWLKYYSSYPEHREKTSKLLVNLCLGNHTYYHRAITIFDKLGLSDVSSKIGAFT